MQLFCLGAEVSGADSNLLTGQRLKLHLVHMLATGKNFAPHFQMHCALLPATSTKTSRRITTMVRKSSANFLNQGSLLLA